MKSSECLRRLVKEGWKVLVRVEKDQFVASGRKGGFPDEMVLLVGRGSQFAYANKNLYKRVREFENARSSK